LLVCQKEALPEPSDSRIVLLSREFAVARFSYPLSRAAVKDWDYVYSKHRGIDHMTTAHDVGQSDPRALTRWRYTLPGHAARTFRTVKVKPRLHS